MRKSSSFSPKDRRPGPGGSSKKTGSGNTRNNDARPFKKNYDSRSPASGDSKPQRSSKPYSGRTADNDRPRFSDKPAFGNDTRSEARDNDRKPRKEFDKPFRGERDKPFADRPKRSFDKPAFDKDRRSEGRGSDRPPRKEFDKPFRGDRDKKPFSDRPKRSFDKPAYDKDKRTEVGESDRAPLREFDKPFRGDKESKPFSNRPKRSFDKPAYDKDNRTEGGGSDRAPRRKFDKPFRGDKESKPFSDRPKRSFDKPAYDKDKRTESSGSDKGPRKEFDKPFRGDKDGKPFGEHPKKVFDKPGFDKEKRNRDGAGGKSYSDFKKAGKSADTRPFREREQPEFDKKSTGKKDIDNKEPKSIDAEPVPLTFSDVVKNAFNDKHGKKKGLKDEDHPGKREQFEDKVYGELEDAPEEEKPKKPFELKKNLGGKKKFVHDHSEGRKKKYAEEDEEEDEDDKEIDQKGGPRLEMPLNKYIAHSGECGRRDAAELVRQGKVKVNGELVLEPGYRVKHDDKVTLSGKKLVPQKGMVYILLNKPKGYITTNEDPQGRRTVMDLVTNSGADRLFPVGRLDRDTSGLLLMTNDGELTQKLCHPSYDIKKVYHVTLDKPLTKADFEKIIEGVELEDGKAIVDEIAYLEKKNELGLEIHSGRNRIVRRIFESLGYVVDKLDRMMYAGLTKKNLPRGKWRQLNDREVVLLKHFKS